MKATFTLWIIIGFLGAIIGVDTWLIVTRGYEATISATMYEFGQAYPVTVFALGIVFGHLYWPNLAALRKMPCEKCGFVAQKEKRGG